MIPVLLLLSFTPAKCDYEDHRCQAERYTDSAGESRKAGDHAGRALQLYLAHREYLYLFDTTGESEALCQARVVLKEALAIKPVPPYLADRFRKSAADASAREREAKVKCPRDRPAKARPSAEGPERPTGPAAASRPDGERAPTIAVVESGRQDAAAPVGPSEESAEQKSTTIAAAPEAGVATPAPVEEAPSPTRKPSAEVPPARVQGPEPAPALSPAALSQADRKRRAHVGGGVVLLLASGGLVGGMVGALAKRGEVTQTWRDLKAKIEGEERDPTAAENTRVTRLDGQYGVLTFVAGASGVAALAGVIGGAVLLSRRPRQVLALPWSGPHIAGLTLEGRF